MNHQSIDPDIAPRAWSDEQIEGFHDGELEAALSRAFARDLAADARLRERLRQVQRGDELVLRALTGPAEGSARGIARGPASAWRGFPTLRAASAVLLASAGVVIVSLALRPGATRTPAPDPSALGPDADITHVAPARSRVLVSVSATHADALFEAPTVPSTPTLNVRANALDAFAEGDLERALELTRAQAPTVRREALAAMGLALSVERRATELLDAMTPLEQIEACEVWASDPRFRAATFSRLRDLASHPELAPRVLELLNEMESQPELSTWVRSYRPRS